MDMGIGHWLEKFQWIIARSALIQLGAKNNTTFHSFGLKLMAYSPMFTLLVDSPCFSAVNLTFKGHTIQLSHC